MRTVQVKTMRKNSLDSPPANAGNGFANIRMALNNVFQVHEMPVVNNSVEMDIEELENFCVRTQPHGLPLFQLEVVSETQCGINIPVKKPFMKYFTIWNDWCFYALEPVTKKEEIVMEGGAIHVP